MHINSLTKAIILTNKCLSVRLHHYRNIHINHNDSYSVRHIPMPLYNIFQSSTLNATLITQGCVQFRACLTIPLFL